MSEGRLEGGQTEATQSTLRQTFRSIGVSGDNSGAGTRPHSYLEACSVSRGFADNYQRSNATIEAHPE